MLQNVTAAVCPVTSSGGMSPSSEAESFLDFLTWRHSTLQATDRRAGQHFHHEGDAQLLGPVNDCQRLVLWHHVGAVAAAETHATVTLQPEGDGEGLSSVSSE